MKGTDLMKHLKAEFFIPDLKGTNQQTVLEELTGPLAAGGFIKSRGIVLETLDKRETFGSTGIGRGVAIPHCRTLVVSDVHIVVGISKKGVEYNASDGKKVHLFFLIVAPPVDTSNLYLPILGRIVELVRDAKLRQAMMGAETFPALAKILQGVTA
jgi:mannitol/fructose-specific phosphotransferase system IIA component (Ntr-type)